MSGLSIYRSDWDKSLLCLVYTISSILWRAYDNSDVTPQTGVPSFNSEQFIAHGVSPKRLAHYKLAPCTCRSSPLTTRRSFCSTSHQRICWLFMAEPPKGPSHITWAPGTTPLLTHILCSNSMPPRRTTLPILHSSQPCVLLQLQLSAPPHHSQLPVSITHINLIVLSLRHILSLRTDPCAGSHHTLHRNRTHLICTFCRMPAITRS